MVDRAVDTPYSVSTLEKIQNIIDAGRKPIVYRC